jgi:hypothetical protein
MAQQQVVLDGPGGAAVLALPAAAAEVPAAPGGGPGDLEQQQQQQQQQEEEGAADVQGDAAAAALLAHAAAEVDVMAQMAPDHNASFWRVTMGGSMKATLSAVLQQATVAAAPPAQQEKVQGELLAKADKASLAKDLRDTLVQLLGQVAAPGALPVMTVAVFDQSRDTKRLRSKMCACRLLPSTPEAPSVAEVLALLQQRGSPGFAARALITEDWEQPIQRMALGQLQGADFMVIALPPQEADTSAQMTAGERTQDVFLRAVATASCILYGLAVLPACVSHLLHHDDGCTLTWQHERGTKALDTPEGQAMAAELDALLPAGVLH